MAHKHDMTQIEQTNSVYTLWSVNSV